MSEIEIRNLRNFQWESATGSVIFTDLHRTRSLILTKDEWESLDKPTYIVVTVRGETFGESTP